MRIGCIFFPHFAVQVEVRDNNTLSGKPIIIGGFPYQLKAVHDASEEAMGQGVKRGMPLRQAYALCPQTIFLPLAEDKYNDVFTHVLNFLAQYTPIVAVGAETCALLDATLERDEFAFVKETMEILEEKTGLHTSAGIASNKFAARVASQVAELSECLIVPDGEERRFLQNLPIDLLPASPESLRRLKLFGIYKMDELAKLPIGAVKLQFGREGQILWELANGIDSSRLMPWKMPEALTGEVSFEPPTEVLTIILSGVGDLLNSLAGQLKQRWQCCRRLTMCLSFSNGDTVKRTFHFKEVTCSKEVMLRQLQCYLERAKFTSLIEKMTLTLTDLCSEEGKQVSFLDTQVKHWEKLITAISQLQQRYGKGIVKQVLYKERCLLPEDSFSFAQVDMKER
jgi:nucleotidyltransferase/DNA polymerase involved in DNA repair